MPPRECKFRDSFERFDSVFSFLQACDRFTREKDKTERLSDEAREWCGGLNWREAFTLTARGDTSAVADANILLNQLVDGSIGEDMVPHWGPAVAGPFPNVPAYLARVPETMFAQARRKGPKKEVNIYYCPVVSATINAQAIYKRGLAVLSLAMQLGRTHNVHLYFMTCYAKGNHVIRLSNPIILSEAAHILTSPSFLRHLSYEYATGKSGWTGGWAPWVKWVPDINQRGVPFKIKLDTTRDDIIIPPLYAFDFESGIFLDPARYINNIIKQHNK